MGIRKRGKHWLVAIELGRDPVTGRRRRAYVTASSRREAEQEESRRRAEAATGLDLEPNRLTLSEYLERWLAAVRPNVAPSTYRYYRALLNKQVVPYIGGIPLAKLRPLHVQGLYARLHEAGRVDSSGGLSGRTVLHVHRVLSEALGQAVRWQMIARNVCDAAEAPQASRRELRVLSPEETRRLLELAAADGNTWGDAVILAVHSGLRRGELLGLKWGDVDLEGGSLTVRRSLQYLPGEGLTLREPKTARGSRTIPLGSTAVQCLRRLRHRQKENQLLAGPAYRRVEHPRDGLVLATSIGTAIDPNNLRRGFRRLLAKAGIDGLRFHDLRHTHASLLLARGVHPKIVSERLGHASVGITLDVYSHVLPSLQQDAVRDLDAWLSGQA
jgi:integrase